MDHLRDPSRDDKRELRSYEPARNVDRISTEIGYCIGAEVAVSGGILRSHASLRVSLGNDGLGRSINGPYAIVILGSGESKVGSAP